MASEQQQRQLAVILHADIEGSTALVRHDETLAHERITDAFNRFSQTIDRYGGTVHEIRGDALVAEFARASDAVCAALAFQRSQVTHRAELNDKIATRIRIGISLGEVVFADETVTGAGVVLAQRVEQLAEPDGVCITAAIHEAVPDRMPFDQESLGEQQVNGFDEPVRVYAVRVRDGSELPEPTAIPRRRKTEIVRWITAAAAVIFVAGGGLLAWWQPWQPREEPASVERMAFPLPDKPSIAVLPFDNFSANAGQEYLADGLTEEIITTLSKSPNLFVIARDSTLTYKGKGVETKQVAEEQGVRFVLEGSIQRFGDRVRINAQLIDALEGHHLWAERYDREFKDIFALQDDITQKLMVALEVELTQGEEVRLMHSRAPEPEAFVYLQRSRAHYYRFNREDNAIARELAAKAIEVSPEYPDAWEWMGWYHFNDYRFGWSADRMESLKQALDVADKAYELDPTVSGTNGLLGAISMYRGEYDEAISHYRKAVELAPSNAIMIGGLGWVLCYSGYPKEAIPLLHQAMRLSPYYPAWMVGTLGLAYMMTGDYPKAIAANEQMIERKSLLQFAYSRLAAIHAVLGNDEKARVYAADLLSIKPDFNITNWSKVLIYQDREALEWELNALRMAGLPEKPPLVLPDKPSIAVLPFDNMSGDPEQDYFTDGMTDDLITDLSGISGLLVIARNSVFLYKDKPVEVRRLARELGVRYVLEGSVRRAGDRLRINAQLVDATTGAHVWAERYDERLVDVFALQDKVTRKIVTALEVTLTPQEQILSSGPQTRNVDAYDAYLKGSASLRRKTSKDALDAVSLFKHALELDPDYSDAYVALAQTYWDHSVDRDFNEATDPPLGASFPPSGYANYLKALKFLLKVRDHPSSQAHALYARMLQRQRRFDEALDEARQAVAVGPNNPSAYDALIEILIYANEGDEALSLIDESLRLDPNLPGEKLFLRGMAYYTTGRLKEAVITIERARRHNPEQTRYAAIQAAALAELGRLREAEFALQEYLSEWSTSADLNWVMFHWPFKRQNMIERLSDSLTDAGLAAPSKQYYWATDQYRLTSEQIRALLANKTMIGRNRGYFGAVDLSALGVTSDEFEVTRNKDAQILRQGELGYFRDGEETRIEDNLLCDYWRDFLGHYCVAIYSNPLGSPAARDEYVFFTLMSIFSFSVFDSPT